MPEIGRRAFLRVAAGAGLAGFALPWMSGRAEGAARLVPIRIGYQTNIWGMPTYYVIQSKVLDKYGIKVQEFPVVSGNLTRDQMVARQVDMGTYAGPAFIVGASKGELVAICVAEYAGRTIQVVARKDLNVKSVADLKGKKIALQPGASITAIFMNQVAPKHGLRKTDYEEVKINVNDMVAAMAAKSVDAMVNTEPYNAIAIGEGIGVLLMDYWEFDRLPVLMTALPEFVEKNPETVVAFLKGWLEAVRDFQEAPQKPVNAIWEFYKSKGYTASREMIAQAVGRLDVRPEFGPELRPYLAEQADLLLKDKKIRDIPDWNKVLRREFLEKAKA